MTTPAIRQKLMTYLANADDSKVRALYTLLEREISEDNTLTLTDEQLQILEDERQLHLSGQSKSYTREEASQIVKGLRAF